MSLRWRSRSGSEMKDMKEPDNAKLRSLIYSLKMGDHRRNSDLNFTKITGSNLEEKGTTEAGKATLIDQAKIKRAWTKMKQKWSYLKTEWRSRIKATWWLIKCAFLTSQPIQSLSKMYRNSCLFSCNQYSVDEVKQKIKSQMWINAMEEKKKVRNTGSFKEGAAILILPSLSSSRV